MGKREYYGLQVLRAIAALAVVAGHSTDYLAQQNGSLPAQLAWIHGPAGVDIFFVISGFVMMMTADGLLRLAHPARDFLIRRVIRILPLYWLLTGLKVALIAWRPQLSKHAAPSLWNEVSSFLFIPSMGPAGEIRPVIPQGWTLSFEMAFYLIFAMGLAAPGRLLRLLTPAIVVLAAVGVLRTPAWPVWTAVADPIVLEFLAGVWLCRIATSGRLPERWMGGLLVVAGFAGLALFAPGAGSLARPLTWGVCAVAIVGGTVALEGAISRRIRKWGLLLGDASYSIYLVQVFVFPVMHKVMDRWLPGAMQRQPLQSGVMMILVSLVLVSLAGMLLHRWIERPMTLRLRSMAGASKPGAVTP